MQGQFQKAAPEPLVAGYRAGANAPCHRRQFVWSCRPMGRIQGGPNLGRGPRGAMAPQPAAGRSILTRAGDRGSQGARIALCCRRRSVRATGRSKGAVTLGRGCGDAKIPAFVRKGLDARRTNRAGVKRGRVGLAPSRCARPHFLSSAVRAHLVSVSKALSGLYCGNYYYRVNCTDYDMQPYKISDFEY
jgi:hypothetical protein